MKNKKLKILHVTNRFYPCVGGVEQNVLDLCLELLKRGHLSDVLCLNKNLKGNKLPQKSTYKEINIFRVPYVDFKYYKITMPFLRLIRKYDVIHVHGIGYFSDLLSTTKFLHKKPLILSTHGGIFHTSNLGKFKKIYFNSLQKNLLKNFDKIVAVSKSDERLFSKIVPKNKLTYIPNGIDYEKYHKLSIAKKDPNIFIYIGRISKNKRIDNLIKVFQLIAKGNSKRKLFIIGEDFDNLLPELKELVKNLNMEKNIFFTGKVSEEQKMNYLKQAKYFMSASEYEGFGISVLEAVAAGCTPILNDIEAFRLLVSRNFIVNYSNSRSFLEQFNKIKNKNMIIPQPKEYSWKSLSKNWENLYYSLLP